MSQTQHNNGFGNRWTNDRRNRTSDKNGGHATHGSAFGIALTENGAFMVDTESSHPGQKALSLCALKHNGENGKYYTLAFQKTVPDANVVGTPADATVGPNGAFWDLTPLFEFDEEDETMVKRRDEGLLNLAAVQMMPYWASLTTSDKPTKMAVVLTHAAAQASEAEDIDDLLELGVVKECGMSSRIENVANMAGIFMSFGWTDKAAMAKECSASLQAMNKKFIAGTGKGNDASYAFLRKDHTYQVPMPIPEIDASGQITPTEVYVMCDVTAMSYDHPLGWLFATVQAPTLAVNRKALGQDYTMKLSGVPSCPLSSACGSTEPSNLPYQRSSCGVIAGANNKERVPRIVPSNVSYHFRDSDKAAVVRASGACRAARVPNGLRAKMLVITATGAIQAIRSHLDDAGTDLYKAQIKAANLHIKALNLQKITHADSAILLGIIKAIKEAQA